MVRPYQNRLPPKVLLVVRLRDCHVSSRRTTEAADRSIDDLSLLGGALCLDLANTVDWRASGEPKDMLVDYEALVAWGRRLGLLGERETAALSERAQLEPRRAASALRRAGELREAIYGVFASIAGGGTPGRRELEVVQAAFVDGLAHAKLRPIPHGAEWSWQEAGAAFDRVAWEAARSAVELLGSDRGERVKRCPAHGCGWLFVDESKNRSRRWCSMAGCGSRMKMRRQYARRRARRHDRTEEARKA